MKMQLKGVVMSGLAALALSGFGETGKFAAYEEFAPGAIAPKGHLEEFLRRERDGMLGNRMRLGYPFDTGLWSAPIQSIHFTEGVYNGDDEDQSGKKDWWSAGAWWPFEQTAYLLDAMIRTANLIKAPALEAEYRKSIEAVLANQRPDGDLFQFLSRSDSQWPLVVFFRSAWAYADRTGDARVWEAFAKHYAGKKEVRTAWKGRNMLNIEGMLQTMAHTGDRSLLEDAERCWLQSDYHRMFTESDRVHDHGVSFTEAMKIPAILYAFTGKAEYLEEAKRVYRRAFALNEQASGQLSCNEFLSGRDPRQGYESCVSADMMWSLGYFIEADGFTDAADRMERIAYNVVPGAITKDYRRHQYLSAVNQVACTPFSQSSHFNYGEATWRQYRPSHFPQCCTGNILRALPAFIQRMWLKDAKTGAPVAMLLGPSEVKGEYRGVRYTVTEETDYPFADEIRFKVRVSAPVEMPIAYRVPSWADRADAGRLVTESRKWSGTDEFTVKLPTKVVFHSDRNWHWFTRGALTLSYAVPSTVTEERTRDPFSPLRIEPSGDWNFAFDLGEVRSRTFEAEMRPSAYPFAEPAFAVRVPVKEIREWQVLDEQRFTPDPPLYAHPNGRTREIELVPYATTLARVTCFPDATDRRQLPVVAAYTTGECYDFDPAKPLAEQVYAPEHWTDKQFRKLYKVPQRSRDLFFDFFNYFGAVTNKLTYAVFRVWSDEEGEATFCVGAANRWQAFMEGREVANSGDGWVEGEMMAPIWFRHRVRKGYNYVYLKVATTGQRIGQFRREWGAKVEAFVEGASAGDGRIRAVQLDLARQMETPTFVSNYIDKVSAWGVNTLQLYLEARASTSVFSLPEGQGYPKGTLRGFVEHAAEKGVTVIPVVSLLGHAELFFKGGTIDPLSEEASGGSRWGSKSKQTFCLSNPATRDFLERHVAELCEVFTGPYFHVGFDESWNMGFCPRCRPKSAPDGGDALFAEFVTWAHGVCARNGKRMMMWDDFFGFHPAALGKVPRDIVMQHWNYTPHISSRGARFNFGGHGRTDWLALYRELGFEAVTVNWYDTENVRTLADYDRRSATKGFVFGQWEDLQLQFHGGNLPRVLARVLLDLEPSKYQAEDAFAAAVRRLFPSLDEAGVLAATAILHSQPPRTMPWKVESATGFRRGAPAFADALAVEVLKASPLRPGTGAVDADPLCERALLDDIVLRGEAGLADEAIARAAPLLTDPRRTPEDVRAAKRALAAERPRLERVIARRQEQVDKWRPGCTPDRMTVYLRDGLKCIDGALKRKEESAPADEKRLELGLTLVDYYGRPKWTVSGLFSDGWRELAKGGWKPARGEWAAFSKYVTFRAAEMPAEVKVEYDGYGAASLRYLQIEDAAGVVRPVKVLSSEGAVTGAENLLVDDMREAVFGVADAIGQIRDTSNPPPSGAVVLRLGAKASD